MVKRMSVIRKDGKKLKIPLWEALQERRRLVAYWRRVPEVNISVMKLMLRRETSTQEV